MKKRSNIILFIFVNILISLIFSYFFLYCSNYKLISNLESHWLRIKFSLYSIDMEKISKNKNIFKAVSAHSIVLRAISANLENILNSLFHHKHFFTSKSFMFQKNVFMMYNDDILDKIEKIKKIYIKINNSSSNEELLSLANDFQKSLNALKSPVYIYRKRIISIFFIIQLSLIFLIGILEMRSKNEFKKGIFVFIELLLIFSTIDLILSKLDYFFVFDSNAVMKRNIYFEAELFDYNRVKNLGSIREYIKKCNDKRLILLSKKLEAMGNTVKNISDKHIFFYEYNGLKYFFPVGAGLRYRFKKIKYFIDMFFRCTGRDTALTSLKNVEILMIIYYGSAFLMQALIFILAILFEMLLLFLWKMYQ